MHKKVGLTLMIFGCVLLLAATSLFAWNQYQDKKAGEAAGAALNEMMAYLEDLDGQNQNPYRTTIKTFEGYEYIGMLDFPTLDLRLPVLAETDDWRLTLAPCRYSGSPKQDNLVIAGHNFDSHFGRLANLQIGDEVILIDLDGVRYTYEVSSIEVLAPNQVDDMVSSGYPLTLFTCTYDIQNRMAVRCEKIKGE